MAKHGTGRVIALTGAVGALGVGLITELEADPEVAEVLAFDLQKPSFPVKKTRFFHTDLTVPGTDQAIARQLADADADTFVHLAFLSSFTHQTDWAHELESIGTLQVLTACAQAPIRKIVLWGRSICYGAEPGNPAYITEEHPLATFDRDEDGFFYDKVDADRQVQEFAAEHPEVTATVLRTAPLVGPECPNFASRFLLRRLIPVVMGCDPLMQFLHREDGVRALREVTTGDHPGIFNIASSDVLPLLTVVALLGRVPVPIPWILARRLAGAMWMGQLIDVPPSFLKFLRYPCVMDTSKAQSELGFEPQHTIRDILTDMISRPAGPATDAITLPAGYADPPRA